MEKSLINHQKNRQDAGQEETRDRLPCEGVPGKSGEGTSGLPCEGVSGKSGEGIPGMLAELYSIPEQDIKSYSPLTFAYIGDAVYELLVRSVLVQSGNTSVNKLNKAASRIECAPRQSAMIKAIKEDLTDEELKIYKRGRNAKSVTKAKNATTAEYRRATGLEAVVGYLYLTGNLKRAAELIKRGVERTE